MGPVKMPSGSHIHAPIAPMIVPMMMEVTHTRTEKRLSQEKRRGDVVVLT